MQISKSKSIDPRKCPIHNQWMKKGQCENCSMARDKLKQQYELEGGSNKPPVQTRKI